MTVVVVGVGFGVGVVPLVVFALLSPFERKDAGNRQSLGRLMLACIITLIAHFNLLARVNPTLAATNGNYRCNGES
jgi:hypothetical protein